MSILKCKMCGGDLEILEGANICECEYCGSRQTVPSMDNEKKITLFGRANRLRLNCEFDKAAGIYESIVAEFPEEAEAYWGLVLCRYGIEYVDDPLTGRKIPTCHRSSFDSVLEDSDFEQACENADAEARRLYREEAKTIEDIRKGILEVSGKEEPYDIFICYKETDENGERTIDSVIAQDVYGALTEKGYRVFFSRISLEDKLGTEYEPYIFAALNSAKVMLVFGTDYEYFNAVWVKNEWSRFLALIASGQKKTLIPCYKGIDAYDMPKEFARLQAQDMGKVGAIQDLLRGIDKLMAGEKDNPSDRQAIIVQQAGANINALIKRGNMALEDGDWDKADHFFEEILNQDAECAEAYLGKLMAKFKISDLEKLKVKAIGIPKSDPLFSKAIRFAKGEMFCRLTSLHEAIQKETDKNRTWRDHMALMHSLISCYCGWGDNYNKGHIVCVKIDGTVVAVGDNQYGQCNVSDWRDIIAVTTEGDYTIGLKSDGTVVATGDNQYGQCDVSDWRDIIAVATKNDYTVGLKSDGTVVATGDNCFGRCDVSDWEDIIAVELNHYGTYGLRSDGTVVTTDEDDHVSDLKDIIMISAPIYGIIGLKSDATVVVSDVIENDSDNSARTASNWKNIITIEDGRYGLTRDGSVVTTYSDSKSKELFRSGFSDIVALSGSIHGLACLKSDGTVVHYNGNEIHKLDWQDIIAVLVEGDNSFGIKSDGTIVMDGRLSEKFKEVQNLKLFNSIDTFYEDRKSAMARRVELDNNLNEIRKQIEELNAQIAAADKANEPKIIALEEERKMKIPAEVAVDRQIQIIKDLEYRRDSCGLFKGKEKKDLAEKISAIERPKLEELKKEAESSKKAQNDRIDSQIEEIKNECRSLRNEVSKLEKCYSEIMNNN